jgi:hypothetical protein
MCLHANRFCGDRAPIALEISQGGELYSSIAFANDRWKNACRADASRNAS